MNGSGWIWLIVGGVLAYFFLKSNAPTYAPGAEVPTLPTAGPSGPVPPMQILNPYAAYAGRPVPQGYSCVPLPVPGQTQQSQLQMFVPPGQPLPSSGYSCHQIGTVVS